MSPSFFSSRLYSPARGPLARLPGLFYDNAHPLRPVFRVGEQVVEVGGTAVYGRAQGKLAAHGPRRFFRLLTARITRGTVRPFSVNIVIRAEDDFTARKKPPRRLGNGQKIPGIKGHKRGVPCGEAHACRRGVPFRPWREWRRNSPSFPHLSGSACCRPPR